MYNTMSLMQRPFCYVFCLVISIVLNIFLVSNIYKKNPSNKLSWTYKAALEAETVASISCSGHGKAFLDGEFSIEGVPICECNSCFTGSDCAQFIQNCTADASSGDPVFLEPFWEQHAASSALLISGWHRMSYSFHNENVVSQQLETHIRKVHAMTQNANTDGKYILLGVGSTQLLNAAVYALSMRNSSSPAKVVSAIPYYPAYKRQTGFFENFHYRFEGEPSSWNGMTDNVIEVLASPNNPDGNIKEAVLKGPFVKTIYDRAYYWPHYSAIPAQADDDIMLFSLSKFTGHAGSRLGWAIIKDKMVYEWMSKYIGSIENSISKDTQLRALKILKVILEGDGRDIFNFAFENMKGRWQKLNEIIALSKRFTIQEISPQYCTFFNVVRGPSPAYAWIKCMKGEDTNCYEVLKAANIIGNNGSYYGDDDRYVRLSLIKRQDDFDLLIYRLKDLFSMEEGVQTYII